MKQRTGWIAPCLLITGLLISNASTLESQSLYVFSQYAKFVEVAVDQLRIVDVGNLWHLDVSEVDRVITPPRSEAIFLIVKSWKLLNIKDPSPAEWEQRGLVRLFRANKGGLLLGHFYPPPRPEASLVGGRVFDTAEGGGLYLTWNSETASDDSDWFVTAHDDIGNVTRQIAGFEVWDRSCLDKDRGVLYTPGYGVPRVIHSLSLRDSTISSRSYESVGSTQFFSKFAAASGTNPCLLLVGEKRSREEPGGTFHLYDYVREMVRATLSIDLEADYHLLSGLEAILMDEKRYVPLTENGNRVEKPGRLHLVDYQGKLLHTFELPKDGKLAAVSSDGRTGVYLSPRLVTMLDFGNRSTQGQVEIPFAEGHVALLQ